MGCTQHLSSQLDGWKEVAAGQWNGSYRARTCLRYKNWQPREWTCCPYEDCNGWAYNEQKRTFCPKCIRSLAPCPTHPAPPAPHPPPPKAAGETGAQATRGEDEDTFLAKILDLADAVPRLGRKHLEHALQEVRHKTPAAHTPDAVLQQAEVSYQKAASDGQFCSVNLPPQRKTLRSSVPPSAAEENCVHARLQTQAEENSGTTKALLDKLAKLRAGRGGRAGVLESESGARPRLQTCRNSQMRTCLMRAHILRVLQEAN